MSTVVYYIGKKVTSRYGRGPLDTDVRVVPCGGGTLLDRADIGNRTRTFGKEQDLYAALKARGYITEDGNLNIPSKADYEVIAMDIMSGSNRGIFPLEEWVRDRYKQINANKRHKKYKDDGLFKIFRIYSPVLGWSKGGYYAARGQQGGFTQKGGKIWTSAASITGHLGLVRGDHLAKIQAKVWVHWPEAGMYQIIPVEDWKNGVRPNIEEALPVR